MTERAGLTRRLQRAARRLRSSIVTRRTPGAGTTPDDAERPDPASTFDPPALTTDAEQAELAALRGELAEELARMARGGRGRS